MARSKSPLQIQIEYTTVSFLLAVLRKLPIRTSRTLLEKIIQTALSFNKQRVEIAKRNLTLAFPEKTPAQHQAILDQSIRLLARSALAFIRLPIDQSTDWISVDGIPHLEKAFAQGRGILAFTAHYGCWELMSAKTMQMYPGRIAAAYRQLDNPKLDAEVIRYRTSTGGDVIERRSLIRRGFRWLKDNGLIGILIDQNFPDGIFVPFFNHPAATTPIISILARRTGAAVLPLHNRWEGERLRVFWGPPLVLSQNPDTEQAIREDTEKMTQVIEGWIREDPSQWLWLHNRWKKQPEGAAMNDTFRESVSSRH